MNEDERDIEEMRQESELVERIANAAFDAATSDPSVVSKIPIQARHEIVAARVAVYLVDSCEKMDLAPPHGVAIAARVVQLIDNCFQKYVMSTIKQKKYDETLRELLPNEGDEP